MCYFSNTKYPMLPQKHKVSEGYLSNTKYPKVTSATQSTRRLPQQHKVPKRFVSATVAGDSLRLNDQEAFSTFDNDNDLSNDNCAHLSRGAFWYGDCTSVNVNGEYKPAAAASDDAVFWYDWKGTSVSLKRVVMKVKPL